MTTSPQPVFLRLRSGVLLVATAIFLYLVLFRFPATPIYLGGDQLIFLLNARRMLDGQVIYRDFFQIVTPGTELAYVALMEIFGHRLWIPHLALVGLGLSFAQTIVVISRSFFSGKLVYLPAVLFMVTAFRFQLNATHHWFSALASLLAVAVLMGGQTLRRVAIAGALCGLASFFTPARGILVGLAISVFLAVPGNRNGRPTKESFKRHACFWTACVGVILAGVAWFISQAGWKNFVDCVVLFGIQYYAADAKWNTLLVYMRDMPSVAPWYRFPSWAAWFFIHVLVPFVYFFFFARALRKYESRGSIRSPQLWLVAFAGLALFAGVAFAPAYNRLCFISAPAMILLVWLFSSPEKASRAARGALWVFAALLAVGSVIDRQSRWSADLDLPGGRLAFIDADTFARYRWLAQRTEPGDFVFVAARAEGYFSLGLRNPTPVPFVTATDYTRPHQVRQVLEGLEKSGAKYVLWAVGLDAEGAENPAGDHLGPLRAYLRSRYRLVEILPGHVEAWERIGEGATPDGAGRSRRTLDPSTQLGREFRVTSREVGEETVRGKFPQPCLSKVAFLACNFPARIVDIEGGL